MRTTLDIAEDVLYAAKSWRDVSAKQPVRSFPNLPGKGWSEPGSPPKEARSEHISFCLADPISGPPIRTRLHEIPLKKCRNPGEPRDE